MTEKPVGERVSKIEGVLEQALPTLRRMEEKLDKALEELETKASKASVKEAHADIDKLKERVWFWSGAAAVLGAIASYVMPKLFGGGK